MSLLNIISRTGASKCDSFRWKNLYSKLVCIFWISMVIFDVWFQ